MNDAEMIRFIRQRNTLTQKELATLLNVSLNAVKSWESGKRTPLGSTVRLLQLIAEDGALIANLRKIQEGRLMCNLDVNEQAQTIMGVHFEPREWFEDNLDAIVSSMYEGYQPSVEDIEWFARSQAEDSPEAVLAMIRARSVVEDGPKAG